MENTQNLYRHFDKDNNLLYVGISISAINRLGQHKKNAHWFRSITNVTIESFDTREKVVIAEREAITNENPLHNLYRPKVAEQEPVKSEAKKSKERLIKRIVHFNPVYTIAEASNVLNIGEAKIKELCSKNILSSVIINRHYSEKWKKEILTRRITGWQLIDFIENWENK